MLDITDKIKFLMLKEMQMKKYTPLELFAGAGIPWFS